MADITSDDLTSPGVGGVPLAGIDACTMVFVLSAISPAAMPAALARVAACLRPGTGRVLFRDYTEGDLAAARLAAVGRQQRLDANFYSRWDGTRSFFFSEVGGGQQEREDARGYDTADGAFCSDSARLTSPLPHPPHCRRTSCSGCSPSRALSASMCGWWSG